MNSVRRKKVSVVDMENIYKFGLLFLVTSIFLAPGSSLAFERSPMIEVGSIDYEDDSRAQLAVAGVQELMTGGRKRIAVAMQYYGWQVNTEPNEKVRLFWLDMETHVRLGEDGITEVPILTIGLTPVTWSSIRPSKSWSGGDIPETHIKFAPITYIRDVPMGIEGGFRVMALRTEKNFGELSQRGVLSSFVRIGLEALGYALEQSKSSSNEKEFSRAIRFGEVFGSMAFRIKTSERTRVNLDLFNGSLSVQHLVGGAHKGTTVVRLSGQTGFSFDVLHATRTTYRPRTSLFVRIGARSSTGSSGSEEENRVDSILFSGIKTTF